MIECVLNQSCSTIKSIMSQELDHESWKETSVTHLSTMAWLGVASLGLEYLHLTLLKKKMFD